MWAGPGTGVSMRMNTTTRTGIPRTQKMDGGMMTMTSIMVKKTNGAMTTTVMRGSSLQRMIARRRFVRSTTKVKERTSWALGVRFVAANGRLHHHVPSTGQTTTRARAMARERVSASIGRQEKVLAIYRGKGCGYRPLFHSKGKKGKGKNLGEMFGKGKKGKGKSKYYSDRQLWW